jgi:hypothetical protein
MDRKHFALVVTAFSLSLVHQAFAADAKHHLQTSGILTGYCVNSPNAPGAYLSGLGDVGNGSLGNTGCNTSSLPPASLPAAPIPMPSNGVLTHLVATAIREGGGDVIVTLIINGSPTALSCALPTGNQNGARVSCSDEQDAVCVRPGDLVAVYLAIDSFFPVSDLTVSLDRKSPVHSDPAPSSEDEP